MRSLTDNTFLPPKRGPRNFMCDRGELDDEASMFQMKAGRATRKAVPYAIQLH
jgi:hypothetical protein